MKKYCCSWFCRDGKAEKQTAFGCSLGEREGMRYPSRLYKVRIMPEAVASQFMTS